MARAVAAALLVASIGAASRAGAATVLITHDQLATAGYLVHLGGMVDGHPFSASNVYETPDIFTVSVDGGPSESLLAFCVDIFHRFQTNTPPVLYETGQVSHNSDAPFSGQGVALSSLISGEIGYLAGLGGHTTDPARLAGIQGAIWRTEYSGLTITGGSSYVGEYVTAASAWGASHPNVSGFAQGIYPIDGQTQGFTTGVPEPASWAMLILGLGATGAVLRRRRRLGDVIA